ncbi:hypothetical protein ZWY2020_002147 [Hordeum vulgare]|nr:hypothetical protein ZWY2020_002147 [Hordeum vulgare]
MAALAAAIALASLLLALAPVVGADTDAAGVAALGNLYTSWNSPAQLVGWSAAGGDPCGAAWTGVSCSGSAITSINLSGMGLNGTLGYQLASLVALTTMDLSNNSLHDVIPYQLPPNLIHLNLARNNFSGDLPYSISNILSLGYLNVSHNSLFQEIGELFGGLNSLSVLDLSFNNLSGNLPVSFVSLSNLSSLYMQNNQLTGTVNVLSNLSLTTLNIANNNFSGSIPGELSSVPDLTAGGNSFINMPASPPPIIMPPSGSPLAQPDRPRVPITFPNGPEDEIPIDEGDKKQGRQTGLLVGLAVGSVAAASCILFALVFCLHNLHKRKDGGTSEPKDFVGALAVNIDRDSNNNIHQDSPVATSVLQRPIGTPERAYGINSSPAKKIKVPGAATSYTVASLQVATNSFCQDSLLGEGSLGRVYKADFPNGKVLAVKKIDSAALSLYEEDHFLEALLELWSTCMRSRRGQSSLLSVGNPQLHDIDALAKMVDPAMDGMYPAKSLSRFADIIALSVQRNRSSSTDLEVVQQLVRLMQRASMLRRQSEAI